MKSLIFVHIPKTSGTTINAILRNQNKNFWYRKPNNNKPDFVSGHVPYGIHEKLNITNFSYFTFVRNPIERTKSFLKHILNSKKMVVGRRTYNRFKDINSFLDYMIFNHISENIMVKQLCGCESIDNIVMDEGNKFDSHDFGHKLFYTFSCRKYPYTDNQMKQYLEIAKENINRFDFVGIQEKGSKEHKRLCDYYDFKYPKDDLWLRKSDNIDIDFYDPNIRERIVKLNKYDIMLYDYIVKEFG